MKDVLSMVLYMSITVAGVSIILALAWMYLNHRDMFLFVISALMAVASLIIMVITLKDRKDLELTSFKILLSVSVILLMFNVINFVLFLVRYVSIVKERRAALDTSNLRLGAMQ